MMNNLSINTEDPPTVQKGTAGLAPQTRAPAVWYHIHRSHNFSILNIFATLSFRGLVEPPSIQRRRRQLSPRHHKFNNLDSTLIDHTRSAPKTGDNNFPSQVYLSVTLPMNFSSYGFCRKDLRSDTISYDAQRMIGHGSFGAVFLAKVVNTDDVVAIKKVLQDKRFKNRELQIMRQIAKHPHPYVVALKHHFISKGSKSDDIYLNLVLEYIPETVYSVSKHYNKAKEPFPTFSLKLYMYQLCRSLAHIHGMGICHRCVYLYQTIRLLTVLRDLLLQT